MIKGVVESFYNKIITTLEQNRITKKISSGFLEKLIKVSTFFIAEIKLKKIISKCKSIDDYIDIALNFEYSLFKSSILKAEIKSLQNRLEIKEFITLVNKIKPKIVVEIGTFRGGTLFLLSRFSSEDALIISIDLPTWNLKAGYGILRSHLYRSFLLKNQKLHLLARDSHKTSTFNEIKNILKNNPIDILFIDGDHTYGGVKQDFGMYSPLVKKDGLIAFHDIVVHSPDQGCHVNEFWNEIKKKYDYQEIVDDWDQKHWGIGLLHNNK